jgi:hypothetical protein
MNMNPHPDWNAPMRWRQVRRHEAQPPRWTRWLAAVLIVVGYALFEGHNAATDRAIAAADRHRTHVAEATP